MSIIDTIKEKKSDELINILIKNDTKEWSDSAFEAIKQVLTERGVPLPQQASKPEITCSLPSQKGTMVEENKNKTSDRYSNALGLFAWIGGAVVTASAIVIWWLFFYGHNIAFIVNYSEGDSGNIHITQFQGPHGASANNIIPGTYTIKGEYKSLKPLTINFGIRGKTVSFNPPFDTNDLNLSGTYNSDKEFLPFSLTFHVENVELYFGDFSPTLLSLEHFPRVEVKSVSLALNTVNDKECLEIQFIEDLPSFSSPFPPPRVRTVVVLEPVD